MSAINHWRELEHCAETGTPLPPHIASWLLTGGARYRASAETGAPIGLDQALGLGRPGAHGWWSVERRERRDALLCELRRRRYVELPDCAAAREVSAYVRRSSEATTDQLLLAILLCGLPVPNVKQLTAIFRKSAGA